MKLGIAEYISYENNIIEVIKDNYNLNYDKIFSDKISEEIAYYTLLPRDYDSSKSYPLLIFLHGMNDTALDWIDKAKLGEIFYKLLEENRIMPMILIIPESGQNGKSWYTNWYKQSNKRYEDFFVIDLLAHLKNSYKVDSFSISGFSMGGYGSLKLALKNLNTFISVSSLAGAINFPRLFFSELKGLGLLRILKTNFFMTRSSNGKHFTKVFGEELKNIRKENVYYILRQKCKSNSQEVKKMRFLLSVGEKDNSNYTMLYQWEDVLWEMKKRELNYKARIIKNEGHFWSYVEKELPYVLTFHSDSIKEATNK
ncbi:MAG: hypothetical protein JXM74_05015 [Fusobacteriaceae bacterium]|nr:hypothetical protein [Fusobacteriaceae bacterium]